MPKKDLFEGINNPLTESALFRPVSTPQNAGSRQSEPKTEKRGITKETKKKLVAENAEVISLLVKTSLLIRKDYHKALKIHAANTDVDLGDLVNEIFEEYLGRLKTPK